MQAKSTMNIKNKIASLRAKIDQIDKKILELLKQRISIALKIGKIKKTHGIAITDTKRENLVLKKAKTPNLKNIYKKIVSESKKIQKNIKK